MLLVWWYLIHLRASCTRVWYPLLPPLPHPLLFPPRRLEKRDVKMCHTLNILTCLDSRSQYTHCVCIVNLNSKHSNSKEIWHAVLPCVHCVIFVSWKCWALKLALWVCVLSLKNVECLRCLRPGDEVCLCPGDEVCLCPGDEVCLRPGDGTCLQITRNLSSSFSPHYVVCLRGLYFVCSECGLSLDYMVCLKVMFVSRLKSVKIRSPE